MSLDASDRLMASFKTKGDAAPFFAGYMGAGIEGALKLLKQGRIREAKRSLADSLDVYHWYKNLPTYISSSAPTPTAGLPAGDKE